MSPLDRRSLTVVIPAFNEEARLPGTLHEVGGFFRRRGWDAEVLVVDDGSRDGTREAGLAAAETFPFVRVIRFPKNHGKGFAVRAGFLNATRDAVLISDADLSTPIQEIERLLPWYDQGYDFVMGSRHLTGSRIEVPQPRFRRVMGRVFNLIISTLAVRGFRDTQCGFKLFRRAAFQEIFQGLQTQGFAFDIELLLCARQAGIKVREVPVRWINSELSKIHPLKDPLRMLWEVLRIRRLL
jgi:dolichyl-phosphate beta-glucosyltransferase